MTTTIHDRELPPDVARGIQETFGLEEAPATLGGVVDAATRLLGDADALDAEALCATESSRHEARVGDEVRQFRCVLDPLVLPFVGEEPVEVRSRSPVSDAAVEMTATREGVSVDPDEALVSFGVATDLDGSGGPDDALAVGYEALCPYVNAFPDGAEYEQWATETEAATTALDPAEAFALARAFGQQLA